MGECAVYVVATVWPTCLGLGLDPEDLVKSLQRNYGVAGQEQFTAAVDLAQANVSVFEKRKRTTTKLLICLFSCTVSVLWHRNCE